MKSRNGFTLIELLVVVAIIGILATVVVVNLSSAQGKAKDARVKNDIEQISHAVEIVRIDTGSFTGAKTDTCAGVCLAHLNISTSDGGYAILDIFNIGAGVKSIDYKDINDKATPLLGGKPLHPMASAGYNYLWITNATSNSDKYIVYANAASDTTKWMACRTGKACDLSGTLPAATALYGGTNPWAQF
jgi:prepilin-type N-terminal cleavage/methylation domain-containing protein